MCIAFFAYDYTDELQLMLASNRDEFWSRPTTPMHLWNTKTSTEQEEHHDDSSTRLNQQQETPILAGRDLEQGGTWLAIQSKSTSNHGSTSSCTSNDDDRRLAVVTNYREQLHDNSLPDPHPSRGKLVTDFCNNDSSNNKISIDDFIRHLEQQGHLYAGFNLLFGSRAEGFYFSSNRSQDGQCCRAQKLEPGCLYGMSNGFLDEPWPKLVRGKDAVRAALDRYNTSRRAAKDKENGSVDKDDVDSVSSALKSDLWQVLVDEWKPPREDLPQTGVSLEIETLLSSIFVQGHVEYNYGTRCSTIVIQTPNSSLQVEERTYRLPSDNDKKSSTIDPSKDFDARLFRPE